MTDRQQPCWRAYVALVAIYALLVSALLPGLALQAQGKANPLDGLSVVICLSSDNPAAQDKAPGAPADHRHDACCILCMVPGLAATANAIPVSTPDYASSRSSPLKPRIALGARDPAELLPIRPRAPPRFA